MEYKGLSGTMRKGYFEYLAYGIVLLFLIVLPLIFWDFGDTDQCTRIIGGWIRIFPFLVIFVIHNFWLLPQFLLKKKPALYLIVTFAVILLVNYLFIYNTFLHNVLYNLGHPQGPGGQAMPDMMDKFHGRGYGHMPGKGRGYWHWHNPTYLIFTYNVIISVFVVGFNTAIRLATEWFRNEQQRKEQEKETLKNQLTALQQQVSPHFFMNTLNNIHALIDSSKEDAKEAILRLSKMMRYLLYDSDKGKISLEREIEFLKSYIDLMRLRLQKSVELAVNFPSKIPHKEIHPFLFIAFIENAFKHGIRPRGKSFIHILLEISGDNLHFNLCNSRNDVKANTEGGGIGLANTRKRLDLLYGSSYQLNIFEREEEYEVDLIIPLP